MSRTVHGDWECVCGILVVNGDRCTHCGRVLLPPDKKDNDEEVEHEASYGFDLEDY